MRRTLLVASLLLAGFFFILNPLTRASEGIVGESAPNFTLTDSNGKTHSLSDYRGKIVVLEWLNYGCPFVKKHYNSGNMQRLQKANKEKGVIWFSVNSSAPGKQGYCTPEQANEMSQQNKAVPTAVLLDPEGAVGKMYGAKTTPHMYIINKEGVLAYNGGIDDKPTTKLEDVSTAKNYVQLALDEVLAGKEVSIQTSQPYGCSVKYK